MARRKAFKLTKSARETYLTSLAETADVRRSAAAAGVGRTTLYEHRRRDPAFAHEWRMALLAGYDRIELALIRRALGLKEAKPDDAEQAGEDAGELDVELALKLLTRHKPVVEQATREAKTEAFRASHDATATALLAKLRAHAKRETLAQEAEAVRIEAIAAPVRRLTKSPEPADEAVGA